MLPEDRLHMDVVAWLRLALPHEAVLHHSPNQSDGSVAWYAKRKRLGLHAGWPDLEIIYRGKVIFIELKAKKGRLSASQKECHIRLKLAGAVVTVCRSLEAVQAFLGQLMPLRARVAA